MAGRSEMLSQHCPLLFVPGDWLTVSSITNVDTVMRPTASCVGFNNILATYLLHKPGQPLHVSPSWLGNVNVTHRSWLSVPLITQSCMSTASPAQQSKPLAKHRPRTWGRSAEPCLRTWLPEEVAGWRINSLLVEEMWQAIVVDPYMRLAILY